MYARSMGTTLVSKWARKYVGSVQMYPYESMAVDSWGMLNYLRWVWLFTSDKLLGCLASHLQ